MKYRDENGDLKPIYLPPINVANEKSTSTENSYSCDYVNKLVGDPVVLFEGQANDNISLSDDLLNYKYIMVEVKSNTFYSRNFAQIIPITTSLNRITVNSLGIVKSSSSQDPYVEILEYSYANKKLTREAYTGFKIILSNNSVTDVNVSEKVFITKITGYK